MYQQSFKCLLKFRTCNYRIVFSKETLDGFDDEWNTLGIDKLTQLVYIKYPSLSKYFNPSFYTLHIFDKDFNEYVILDDTCPIENLSKIRVVPVISNNHSDETSFTDGILCKSSNINDNSQIRYDNIRQTLESKNADDINNFANAKISSIEKMKNNSLNVEDIPHSRRAKLLCESNYFSDKDSEKDFIRNAENFGGAAKGFECSNISPLESTRVQKFISDIPKSRTGAVDLSDRDSERENLFNPNIRYPVFISSNERNKEDISCTVDAPILETKNARFQKLSCENVSKDTNNVLNLDFSPNSKKSKSDLKVCGEKDTKTSRMRLENGCIDLSGRDSGGENSNDIKRKQITSIKFDEQTNKKEMLDNSYISSDIIPSNEDIKSKKLVTLNAKDQLDNCSTNIASISKDTKTSEKKILIKDYGRKTLYEQDFFVPNLDQKITALEIFKKYNSKFCRTKHNIWCPKSELWFKINNEIKMHGIEMDFRREFIHCLNQYVDIITYLLDWTELECQRLWPLFLTFHDELVLSPFQKNLDNLISKFENHPKHSMGRSVVGPLQQKTKKKRNRKSSTKNDISKYIFRSQISKEEPKVNKGSIIFKNDKITLYKKDFKIKNKLKKNIMIDTIIQEIRSVKSFFGNSSVRNAWNIVTKRMHERSEVHWDAQQCSAAFEGLLKQYKLILENLIDWDYAECQKLWPFFNRFHFEIDFALFLNSVQCLKEMFNAHHKKISHGLKDGKEKEKDSSEEKESFKISEFDKRIRNRIETRKLKNEEERLIKCVLESLKMSNASELDFWQKIAYDMSSYLSPINDESSKVWHELFCSLLDEYSTELRTKTNGRLTNSKLFEHENIATIRNMLKLFPSDSSKTNKTESDCLEIISKSDELSFPIYMKDQIAFMKIVESRLSRNSDLSNFWNDVRNDVGKSGLYLNPQLDVEKYFGEMINVLMQVMEATDDIYSAVIMWPFFEFLNSIDLSPIVKDVEKYKFLKAKFK